MTLPSTFFYPGSLPLSAFAPFPSSSPGNNNHSGRGLHHHAVLGNCNIEDKSIRTRRGGTIGSSSGSSSYDGTMMDLVLRKYLQQQNYHHHHHQQQQQQRPLLCPRHRPLLSQKQQPQLQQHLSLLSTPAAADDVSALLLRAIFPPQLPPSTSSSSPPPLSSPSIVSAPRPATPDEELEKHQLEQLLKDYEEYKMQKTTAHHKNLQAGVVLQNSGEGTKEEKKEEKENTDEDDVVVIAKTLLQLSQSLLTSSVRTPRSSVSPTNSIRTTAMASTSSSSSSSSSASLSSPAVGSISCTTGANKRRSTNIDNTTTFASTGTDSSNGVEKVSPLLMPQLVSVPSSSPYIQNPSSSLSSSTSPLLRCLRHTAGTAAAVAYNNNLTSAVQRSVKPVTVAAWEALLGTQPISLQQEQQQEQQLRNSFNKSKNHRTIIPSRTGPISKLPSLYPMTPRTTLKDTCPSWKISTKKRKSAANTMTTTCTHSILLPYTTTTKKKQKKKHSPSPMSTPKFDSNKNISKRFSWTFYPELEEFLIKNRNEFLSYSSTKNYTTEQRDYNNQLTSRFISHAKDTGYYDVLLADMAFTEIRNKVRSYYKSYIQSYKRQQERHRHKHHHHHYQQQQQHTT